MRNIVFSLLLFFIAQAAYAQAWEIRNTELKAERQGKMLLISFIDNRKSILVEADTAYMSDDAENLFIIKDQLIGLIDPWDLSLLQKPAFIALRRIMDEYFMVENEQGIYFSSLDSPDKEGSAIFESVELLELPANTTGEEKTLYLVQRKGKYGVLSPDRGINKYLIEPQYDEIVAKRTEEYKCFFWLRIGKKWGLASEDNLCVDVKYDDVNYLGDFGEEVFVVWKKGLCGLLSASSSQPLTAISYTYITKLKKVNLTYIFVFRNEELEGMYIPDMDQDWTSFYRPLMLTGVESLDKTFLIYKMDEEMFSLELSREEIQQLELLTLDYIFLK